MHEVRTLTVLAAFAWALVLQGLAVAQEAGAPPTKKEPAARPPESPFFRKAAVDFWGDRKETTRARGYAEGPAESVWAEPIQGPDGRTSLYVPPKAVLAFLENPTRESAAGYLAWQEERMKKLKTAIEILSVLQKEKEAKAEPVRAEPEAGALNPLPAVDILYFKREGCPYCKEEDKVLSALLLAQPGQRVRTLLPGDAPELWKGNGVTVVPTLVLSGAGGRREIVRGYAPTEKLVSMIQEVNRAGK
jgi:hypothetical protein